MRSKILFEEKQKLTQWWLWLLLMAIGLVPLYGLYKQFIIGEPFGNKPLSNEGLLVFCLFVFGLILFFWMSELRTKIYVDKIEVNYFPFLKRTFKWEDVESTEIIKYDFVGYGIRFSLNYGTVYNVKGNQGLFLKLKNGKRRLIGTQRPEELRKIVEEWRSL